MAGGTCSACSALVEPQNWPQRQNIAPKEEILQSVSRTLSFRRSLTLVAGVAAVFPIAGCHKKAAPPPPPPPLTNSAPAPTADITANPTAIEPGGSVILTWHTSNASNVSIEGIGEVATSGTQVVKPTESTNYHLIARGDGGSTDATARLTVNSAAAPASNLNENDMDDSLFHQNVQDVFYDYDAYEIRPDAAPIIAKDAAFLNQHTGIKVVMGGYCDERGSTEYNLSLGENRANAAKQALVNAGVRPDRLGPVGSG